MQEERRTCQPGSSKTCQSTEPPAIQQCRANLLNIARIEFDYLNLLLPALDRARQMLSAFAGAPAPEFQGSLHRKLWRD